MPARGTVLVVGASNRAGFFQWPEADIGVILPPGRIVGMILFSVSKNERGKNDKGKAGGIQ